MSDLGIYFLGVFTLPALGAIALVAAKLLTPDGFLKRECGACDWTQHDRVPIIRWFRWTAHSLHGRTQPWHRQSLAILMLEYGRDPITRQRLGEEFRVTGPGETVLTNMHLATEGRH